MSEDQGRALPQSDGVPPPWQVTGSGRCRSCKAEVWWAEHPDTGKRSPFNADGSGSHFATCPQAGYWRGGGREAG